MKIYGFSNSKSELGDAVAIAIDETGEVLATHVCSAEGFAAGDLGMNGRSNWKHDSYDKAHPDGWECEFVRIRDDRDSHEGLQSALKAHDMRHNT